MFTLIDWIEGFLKYEDTKLLFVYSLLIIGTLLDFLMGTVSAMLSEKEIFSSKKLKRGLAEKVMIILFCFFLIPIAISFDPFGIATLYVIYTGFIVADISSMIGHIKGNGSDSKNHEGVFKLIESVLKKMFSFDDSDKK